MDSYTKHNSREEKPTTFVDLQTGLNLSCHMVAYLSLHLTPDLTKESADLKITAGRPILNLPFTHHNKKWRYMYVAYTKI